MTQFIIRRFFIMIPTLLIISVVSFVIIQLPPGDFVTQMVAAMEQEGRFPEESFVEELRHRYGLDRPIYIQYFRWLGRVVQGDLGYSFAWNQPVARIIGSRILLTMVISFTTVLFTWVVAFPIGVYSATHQYSVGDYSFTVIGFLGLSIPNFMLALILMWISYTLFDSSIGGLFSREFVNAPWSLAKFVDFLEHLWIPVIVVGTAGTAGLIRILRANLLDELQKPYVTTARTKGMKEWHLIMKYPVRVAINPFISTIGWLLPTLISGSTITAVVLSLPTSGPLLLAALRSQDMYLAGSFLLILSSLTVVGTLVSDILLAWVDPRIRLG